MTGMMKLHFPQAISAELTMVDTVDGWNELLRVLKGMPKSKSLDAFISVLGGLCDQFDDGIKEFYHG